MEQQQILNKKEKRFRNNLEKLFIEFENWRNKIESAEIENQIQIQKTQIHKPFLILQCPQLIPEIIEAENKKNKFTLDFTKIVENENEKETKYEPIKPEVVEQILDFIYTGEINISEQNVLDVHKASILLKNEQLDFWCEDFIKESFTDGNVIEYLQIPWIQKNPLLFSTGVTYLKHNLSDIIHSKDRKWKSLPKKIVDEIFDSENINITSELDLFEFAINWIIYQIDGENGRYFRNIWRDRPRELKEEGVKKFRENFLKKIRFPLMPKEEIESVDTFKILSKEVIQKLKDYIDISSKIPWLEGNYKEEKEKKRNVLINDLKTNVDFKLPEKAFEVRKFDPKIKDLPKQENKEMKYDFGDLKKIFNNESFGNYQQIFSTKKDQFSIQNFRRNCEENKGKWFMIFTTTTNDIILAFSTITDYFKPEKENYYIPDDSSFIAVLQVNGEKLTEDQLMKYGILYLKKKDQKNNCALIYSVNYGPVFGDHDLSISDTLLNCYCSWGFKYLPKEINKPLFGNSKFWENWRVSKDEFLKKMGLFFSKTRHRIIDFQIFTEKK
ncbi:actin-binding protein ipp [Anaeramoeba ignava]|uniref:Actin-binding protein ipp n=1 Tax=Anaeramoeba ignava TaxID=1746090 RepID=A0A9Q0LLS5_ANAIG|nr:actin-binding protein ipp [Anaeramoeba ignava]